MLLKVRKEVEDEDFIVKGFFFDEYLIMIMSDIFIVGMEIIVSILCWVLIYLIYNFEV